MAFPLSRLGFSKAKLTQFSNHHLSTVEALLEFLPRKYYDLTTCRTVKEAQDGELSVIYCQVVTITPGRYGKPGTVFVRDKQWKGFTLELFSPYMLSQLKENQWFYIAGRLTYNNWLRDYRMTNPVLISKDKADLRITPVYTKIKGMSTEYLTNAIDKALAFYKSAYKLTERDLLARKLGLMEHIKAYQTLHHPHFLESIPKAQERIAFDHIYGFYQELAQSKKYAACTRRSERFFRDKMDAFIKSQPFALTIDQRKVIETVVKETEGGNRLDAIISGDVGCGKTMVAMSACCFMAENGYQSVLMAPTLVLARQHFSDFQALAAAQGFRVALLTSEVKKKERETILAGLKNGSIDILIGTHSVLSPELKFSNLGLTVVDEEHKFGVVQKETLQNFCKAGAHHLSMTATPIPRSMAMGVYGNSTDVLSIRSMPAGRKPVKTSVVQNLREGALAIKEELDKGHQAYVLCPYISSSDSNPDVWSTEEAFEELQKYIGGGIKIERISGDMKNADILAALERFAGGETGALVSTTIVEVGVNVPNATAMLILSADHFGLSALHQIRGRVCRSSDQGYCYLLPDTKTDKLDILCQTNDGFAISEEDMRRRGPGNLLGIEQKGADRNIELILAWPDLAAKVRAAVL